MRIAVVSDIHGNLPALQAVVRDMHKRGFDRVVNLGDSLSGPLLPLETAQFLMQQDWLHLAGNHERQILMHGVAAPDCSDAFAYAALGAAELAWLHTLKGTAEGELRAFFCHGTPRSDLQYFLETVAANGHLRLASATEIEQRLGNEPGAQNAQLILCGHTHMARAVRRASGQLIVNPGSVGLPAFVNDYPTMHVMESGAPDARYGIVEYQQNRGWSACLYNVPYDYAQMAQLASQGGRAEWEVALRSGYMSSNLQNPQKNPDLFAA